MNDNGVNEGESVKKNRKNRKELSLLAAAMVVVLSVSGITGCGKKETAGADTTATEQTTGQKEDGQTGSESTTAEETTETGAETYTYSDATVEEYYLKEGDYTDDLGDDWTYSYHIPKINSTMEAAEQINGEIQGKYEYYANNSLKDMEQGINPEYFNIGWYTCRYKDILSIILYADDLGGMTEYSVYNCDLESGKNIFDSEDLLDKIGVDEELVWETTRSMARESFVRGNEAVPLEEREEYGYNAALERTVSDEYIKDAARIYLDDTGKLMTIIPVASLAGADWYFHTFSLDIEINYNPDSANEASRETESDAQQVFYTEDHAPENASEILLGDITIQETGIINEMSLMDTGETETVYGEKCSLVAAGTNTDDQFVREKYFAVSSSGAIYEYDVLNDKWTAFNMMGKIYSNWNKNILLAVFTDPTSDEYFAIYDGESDPSQIMLLCMQSGARVRIEEVKYDSMLDQYNVIRTIKEIYPTMRGLAECVNIEMTDSIPKYRITVEYNGAFAYWYAIYDGSGSTVYVSK